MGPPPATMPTPTSHCEMMVFLRLAKLMSQASVISLPLPVARPRIRAMEATGAGQPHEKVRPRRQTRRTRWQRGQVLDFRSEIGVIQEVAVHRTVEDTTLTCWSASIASMTAWNSRTISGPMTLIGGLSIVTRQ